MNPLRLLHLPALAALLLAGLFLAAPRAAFAAQGSDNCRGYIDTLPALISTQGVWCLRHDLATNITSGKAIEIATNNVTIDCNDFKIGGLAAGAGSNATGIFASARLNATVRHCSLRGFYVGIELDDGGGHLVEDNRFDNNLFAGIWVQGGSGSRVRRNAVYDTGGLTGTSYAYGIYADADIDDNTVSGVFTDAATALIAGIYTGGDATRISGNHVSGLAINGSNVNRQAYGIYAGNGKHNAFIGNHIVALAAATPGWGIKANDSSNAGVCIGNTVARFQYTLYCLNGNTSGNLYH